MKISKFKGLKKIALTIGSVLTIGVSGTLFVKYGVPFIKKKFKKDKVNNDNQKQNNQGI